MSTAAVPYAFEWSTEYPHAAWIDLHNKGVIHEIVVVSMDNRNGDLYFIELSSLDEIDRQRMLGIVTKRDAVNYPLWDLMSGTTLKNGVNALEYFNQLVLVRTASGQIFRPQSGKYGAAMLARPPTRAPIKQAKPAPVGSVDLAEATAQVQSAAKKTAKPPKVSP